MPRQMPVHPVWLKADLPAVSRLAIGVDRENGILHGYVVAQEGPFKSQGRGEFDESALRKIVQLGNAAPGGLKSRFNHATLSDDAPGKHLGRSKNFRMDQATVDRRGRPATVKAVRADLHLSQMSFDTPSGNLGGYVLGMASEDPGAISSSLVLQVDEEYRLERDGTPKRDGTGNTLPPLWRPKVLHSSDIVDVGDAVDDLLSADRLGGISLNAPPDRFVRAGVAILDKVFAGQSFEVVQARCMAFLERYRQLRFHVDRRPPNHATPGRAATSGGAGRKEHLRRVLQLIQAGADVDMVR